MTYTTKEIAVTTIQESKLSQIDLSNLGFGQHFTDHMFSAVYNGTEWTDMELIPFDNLTMHPANLMMHYGQSIFEGMKAYMDPNGKDALVFRPEMNARRFMQSAERMCMEPVPEQLFLDGINALVEKDKKWIPNDQTGALYIRPFEIAWDNFLGVKPSDSYRFMIICSPVGAYYTKPVNIKIETEYVRAAAGGTGQAKAAGNYAASLYPAQLAKKQGFDQILWTDAKEHKYIEEAGTMNVMFMIDGVLCTSPLTSTILPGITRDSVLQLAKHWGVQIHDGRPEVEHVVKALQENRVQEAFGVGTAATIAPIASISYKNQSYAVPESDATSFSTKAGKYLNEVKRGLISDEFHWNAKV